MSMALVVLGINSFVYHATLRQTTQFGDEFSMFILGGALLQGVYTINQSPAAKTTITASIWFLITVLSAMYAHTGNILHHSPPSFDNFSIRSDKGNAQQLIADAAIALP